MARRRTLEDQLAALSALAQQPIDDAAKAELRKTLASGSNHLAAKAATIIRELGLSGFADDLVAAFGRFMQKPTESDKGCAAKTAIAETLDRLEVDTLEVYLPGVRHVQLEPVFGGSADTAGELRSRCAFALVRMGYADVMTELAELLADDEAPCRAAAAQAIGYTGYEAAAPLLRFKAKLGDAEPQVTSEVLAALLRLTPRAALSFVERYLRESNFELAQAAAVALGQSRLPEAFAVLRQWFEDSFDDNRKRTALLAIAMLRHDEPLSFLIDLIADGAARAPEAVAALAMYRHDETLRQRIDEAVRRSPNPRAAQAYREHFTS